MMTPFLKDWHEAAEKTKSAPFFSGVPCVRSCPEGITIRESVFRKLLSLFVIALGVLVLIVVLRDPGQHGGWAIPLIFIGIVFMYGGVTALLSARKLLFDRTHCYLYYGSILSRSVLAVPRDNIVFNLEAARDQGYWSALPYGSTMITLSLKDSGDAASAIPLAAHSERHPIQRLFERLTHCVEEGFDHTIVEEVLENGQVVKVPQTGISRSAQAFRSATLYCGANGEKLIIGRSFYIFVLWLGTFLFGLSGVVFLIVTDIIHSSVTAALVFITGFALVGGLGIVGIFPGFGTVCTIIDKNQKIVILRQGFFGTFFGKREFLFQDIVGFQICPKYTCGDPEGGDYTVFEINLVLHDHTAIERVHVMSDKDETQIESYAKQLSDFSEKPIFDHRGKRKEVLE